MVRHNVVDALRRGRLAEVRRMTGHATFRLAGLPLLFLYFGRSVLGGLLELEELRRCRASNSSTRALRRTILSVGRIQPGAKLANDSNGPTTETCPTACLVSQVNV